MTNTLDQLGARSGRAIPDRRPSANTQAAIADYDYRYACYEVIDGADIATVCRRLDVPGGPSILGPKVVALRARLADCARVGRPPPERPTAPPVSPLACIGKLSEADIEWTDKRRLGLSVDTTANPSTDRLKGRALVTRAAEVEADAPPPEPPAAPWREALRLKPGPAAIRTVAEQEGADPVKALRAAGFTVEADALRAQIEAAATKQPDAPRRDTVMFPTCQGAGEVEAATPMQSDGAPLAVLQDSEASIVATRVPTAEELEAMQRGVEELWEQMHNGDTVRAAQEDHARQATLFEVLRAEEPPHDVGASAPSLPVARGRTTQTMAASAQTEVVKKPMKRARKPAQPVAASPPSAPMQPTKPAKTAAAPAPAKTPKLTKPPTPPRPAAVAPAPVPTPPVARPPRRVKVSAAATPKTSASPAPAARRRGGQPNPPPDLTMLVPPKVQQRVGPEVAALLNEAARWCALTKLGTTPIADGYLWTGEQADDELHAKLDTKKAGWSQHHQRTTTLRMQALQRARVRPIDLGARKKEVDDNLDKLRSCPPYAGVPEAVWQGGLDTIAQGLNTVNQWNDELSLPKSTLSNWMRRHGVNSKLLPDLLSHKGRNLHTTGTPKASDLGVIFGRGVRRQRAIYGITQIELAVALRIHSTMLPSIEQGIVQPRVELVRRLTDLFKVPWRTLFDIDDVQLLTLLVAGVAGGARNHCCGDLLRHLVLPSFGVEVPRLTDHQRRVLKGHRAAKSAAKSSASAPPPEAAPAAPRGRIERSRSDVDRWARTRFTVLVDDVRVAYADVPNTATAERVRLLLINQLVLCAKQGETRLPRGWLAHLPEDVGPPVRARVKEWLAEQRPGIDNAEHALGLPARDRSGPDVECDIDLSDAELAAVRGTTITNRADLYVNPTEGDHCEHFALEAVVADCAGDGHYGCHQCKRLDHRAAADARGDGPENERPAPEPTKDDTQ